MRMISSATHAAGFFFIVANLISQPCVATGGLELKEPTYLRKLSFHLRGLPPDPAEYMALKKAKEANDLQSFFEKKKSEYLASLEYTRKMSYRLEELFRLKTSPRVQRSEVATPPYPERNALNSLFDNLTLENQSWDALLLQKNYRLYPRYAFNYPFILSDFVFLGALNPELPQIGRDEFDDVTPIWTIDQSFSEDDPRIAGAITTARFFGRYTTTELNKNRRRAAAVFNIFLCDPMSAAVPPPPANPDDLLDRAFPDTADLTEEDIRRLIEKGDEHGSNQACAQCHYKLDPMGRTFAASALTLAPMPSPGRLVFKTKQTKELVDIPARGIGDIAKAISHQKDYVDCQVSYFWKWFIGTDRELSNGRREELARAFEGVGRRTNDFVAHMVSIPEFRTIDLRTPTQARADAVKNVLKNCVGCHDARIPSFVSWPIGGNQEAMSFWIGRISARLDLKGDGANRTMPPDWSGWHPSEEDLALLKSWVADGAPDENGAPQIGESL